MQGKRPTEKTYPPSLILTSTNKYGEMGTTLNPAFDKDVERLIGEYEIPIPQELLSICKEIRGLGGRALIVGGSIRDFVIGAELEEESRKPKDFDIEIYGVAPDDIVTILYNNFPPESIKQVGRAFGVYKVNIEGWDEPLDFSITRRDNNTGPGHKDVVVEGDPNMTITDAARRRDLTINSMAYDPLTETLYDPFNGIDSVRKREIAVTDQETFQEDPLRVLRVVQFASRLEFYPNESTIELCKQMVEGGALDYLPRERVKEEITKMFLKSKKPSIGLELLREIGYVEKYWPELYALVGLQQEQEWHPEGDAWTHTLQVVDAAAAISEREIAAGRFLTEKQRADSTSQQESLRTQYESEFTRETLYEFLQEHFPHQAAEIEFKASRQYRKAYENALQTQLRTQRSDNEQNAVAVEYAKRRKKQFVTEQIELTLQLLLESGEITDLEVQTIRSQAETRALHISEQQTKENLESIIKSKQLVLLLAALCHDLGKATTTDYIDGAIRSRGHESAGIAPTISFIERIYQDEKSKRLSVVTAQALPLVAEHMHPKEMWMLEHPQSDKVEAIDQTRAMRRLADRLAHGNPKSYPQGGESTPYMLALIAEADQRGRNSEGATPLESEFVKDLNEWQTWFFEKARAADVEESAIETIITGQDIINRVREIDEDAKGGVWVGVILSAIHQDQLDGAIKSQIEAVEKSADYYQRFKEIIRRIVSEISATERDIWVRIKIAEDPRIVLQTGVLPI